MFTQNKVIDKNKVQRIVEGKKVFNIDMIKKMCDAVDNAYNQMGIATSDSDYYEQYFLFFSNILCSTLSLDELEFINDNNLFEFDKNNLLDQRCQAILTQKIKNDRQTLANLNVSMQKENLESYFQNFGDIHDRAIQGLYLYTILGLGRDDVELTELGIKLKFYIDNIKNIDSDLKTLTKVKRKK